MPSGINAGYSGGPGSGNSLNQFASPGNIGFTGMTPEENALFLLNANNTQQQPGTNAYNSQVGTGTDQYGAPSDPAGRSFWEEYLWSDPAAGIGNVMAQAGRSTDINSSFYNAMTQLAPGLKLLSVANSPYGVDPMQNWQANAGSWFGQGMMPGGGGADSLGALSSALRNVFSGGASNPDLAGYLDQLSPQQMMQAVGSMIEAAGYGNIAPEFRSGIANNLMNLLNQFNIQGGNLLANLPPGTTDSDVFRKFVLDNVGNTLGRFGIGG